MPIARGSVLGFIIGIVPGSAHIISSFLSYALEKRISKHPEEFGKGAVAGVAGPESANNSASTGAFVPMLALGLPTGPVTAVLMAALLIHGVPPGPQLVTEHPDVFWGFIASMYVGNLMLLALNLPLVGMFVNVLRIPYAYLYPLIIMFCIIGVYEVNHSIVDVWIMLVMGMRRLSAAQVRLRPGAAGAGPRHRADLRDEPAPVADHVERRLDDLLRAPDRGRAARDQRRPADPLRSIVRHEAQGLAGQARRGRGERERPREGVMRIPRRRFLQLAAAGGALVAAPHAARAQAYPSRPITLMVFVPPGGAPDIVAPAGRAAAVAAAWSAGGHREPPRRRRQSRLQAVARAPADGYTLLLIATPHAVNVTLYEKQDVNVLRDIEPVASIDDDPFSMVVNPFAAGPNGSGVHRLREVQSRQNQYGDERQWQPESPGRGAVPDDDRRRKWSTCRIAACRRR